MKAFTARHILLAALLAMFVAGCTAAGDDPTESGPAQAPTQYSVPF